MKTKPNRTLIKKWLKALRSEEYQQGKQRLCSSFDGGLRYCCLGVLCHVYCPNGFDKNNRFSYDGVAGCLAYPPHSLRVKAGLDDSTTDKLIEMNDRKGRTFKQIAAYLEKKLLK